MVKAAFEKALVDMLQTTQKMDLVVGPPLHRALQDSLAFQLLFAEDEKQGVEKIPLCTEAFAREQIFVLKSLTN